MKLFLITLFCLFSELSAETVFREDFRDDVEAHIPVTNEDLTSDFLTLSRLGPGADKLKLSYHPEVKNDPHYVWNGECSGPTLLAFTFKETLDLSAPGYAFKIGSKNVGKSELQLAVQVGEDWFVRKEALANKNEWNSQTVHLLNSTWLSLDPQTIAIGEKKQRPDLKKVRAIGFASPIKPRRSKDCTRLNWFELIKDPVREAGFIEPETPFLRSALVFKHEGKEHFVRRGVLVPLHYKNRWACFDPDTLHWVAVWEVPEGEAPITYDSMAGVSFPDKKAKAKRAPRLVGEILLDEKEIVVLQRRALGSGVSWQGIHLTEEGVAIQYGDGGDLILHERVRSDSDTLFERIVTATDTKPVRVQHRSERFLYQQEGAQVKMKRLKNTTILSRKEARGTFPEVLKSEIISSQTSQPFEVTKLGFPHSTRPIRATDLAFRSNGDAFLSTLDGDIWRIQAIESESPEWTRIATGIFEPMAIEVDSKDRLFTLGRDQITELIDTNQDGHIDFFRNASDVFLQTLHTRDYATSLAIGKDGSFYLAKGGIYKASDKGIENELSEHRGTVLHITPDGKTATVLADGLRLPYVGLRKDGSVFASDQQGHYIPSSPLHLLSKEKSYLGFEPTNFQKRKDVTPPLLWYPYQANRSSAAFCSTSAKAFPDLPDAFLQASWNGRLFAIETPEKGRPFSWKLPLQLDFPTLNGASHPQSGRLYVTGLGISGYKPTTTKLVGLASIKQSESFPVPTNLDVTGDTLTVTFSRPLAAEEAITPGHPTLRLFSIKRSPKYGSGHYRWDREPGEHQFAPSHYQLSPDRQSFQATFDTLRRSDLFDLQLNISTATSTFPIHLYTRPHHLPEASAADLQRLAAAAEKTPKLELGQSKLGQAFFAQVCASCHSLDGQKLTGPTLKGVGQRLSKAKLRESILDPTAEISEGFEPAMPSFEGVIPLQDLEHLLTFLETLTAGDEEKSAKEPR